MNKREFIAELQAFHPEFITPEQDTDNTITGYTIRLASFGDYDNSGAIERANQKSIVAAFADFVNIDNYPYYNACTISLTKLDMLNWSDTATQSRARELIDTLSAITDYPVIDDEALFETEREMYDEAWENWVRSDFVTQLANMFPEIDFVEMEFDSQKLRQLFEQLAEEANEYWIVESGGNAYVDVPKVAKRATLLAVEQCTE